MIHTIPTQWITLYNVHTSEACRGRACVIHNPSDHHMRYWPLRWLNGGTRFMRACAHDHMHPDPDQLDYWAQTGQLWKFDHECCPDMCCKEVETYTVDFNEIVGTVTDYMNEYDLQKLIAMELEEIDDAVDDWHEFGFRFSLQEHLNMSDDDYSLWVRDPEAYARQLILGRRRATVG